MADTIMAVADEAASLIDTLEALDLERAPLVARYGPGGTWDHERKTLLAHCAAEIRLTTEVKLTEAAIDERARTQPGYNDLIIAAVQERTKLAEMDAKRVALDHRISLAKATIYAQGRLAGVV